MIKSKTMSSSISSGSYWVVNKRFTQVYGIDVSILLSDLISRYDYWAERGVIDNDGYFFCVKDIIEQDTTLSSHRQNEALKILIKEGIVEVKRKGIPPKTHYRFDYDKLNDIIRDLYR